MISNTTEQGSLPRQRRTSSWTSLPLAPPYPSLPSNAESTPRSFHEARRTRTHTAAPHTSPVTRTFSPRRFQNQLPPRAALNASLPRFARSRPRPLAVAPRRVSFGVLEDATTDVESALTVPPDVVGAPRWPSASAWVAGRPQRKARGRPPHLDWPRAGHLDGLSNLEAVQ